jgi:RNA polymerase sigma-70 factor (ECF subfamily)
MPDEREAAGLLALILLTDARRATRVDEAGQFVLLQDQDRSKWDSEAIAEGQRLVRSALRGGLPGRFALQATIAALHAEAPTYQSTDWKQIVDIYNLLLETWHSPVVALNRAAAVSMAFGAQAGLDAIDDLDVDLLAHYVYLPATRADLLRQLGRRDEAAREYLAALALTDNMAEQAFLRRRLTEVTG